MESYFLMLSSLFVYEVILDTTADFNNTRKIKQLSAFCMDYYLFLKYLRYLPKQLKIESDNASRRDRQARDWNFEDVVKFVFIFHSVYKLQYVS